MANDLLSIKILGKIDPAQTKKTMQSQLDKIANELNVTIGVDTKTISKISSEVKHLQQKIAQQAKGLKVINDKETIKNINKIQNKTRELFTSVEKAVKEYSKLGKVEFEKKFDPLTKQMTSFTLNVTKANGEVSKLKYALTDIDTGNGISKAYELISIKDKNNLQNVNEKILKQEQQIKSQIDKQNKSLKESISLFQRRAKLNVDKLVGRTDQQILDNYMKEVNSLSSKTPDVTSKMNDLSMKLKEISANAEPASHKMKTFGEQVSHAMNSMGVWAVAGTAIFGTIKQLEQMYQDLVMIDSQLTEIRKVSDGVDIKTVLDEATKSAYQFGRTLDGALSTYSEIFKQGYNQADAIKLSKNSMLMSTIGEGITDDSATKYLTSIMKQYKLSVDQTSDIIDSLNNLDNKTGASMLDIAQSLSKSASAAKNAGIGFHTLSAESASLVESLRISGSEAGNFLKTLSTRLIRKDTLDTLERYGITVRKANGDLESGTKILEELSSKWNTYNQITKNTIAQLLGGVYHINKVNVLLSHQKDILKYTEESANSYGSATSELATFQDSLQYKSNQLKTSLQELAETFAQVGGKQGAGALLTMLTNSIQGFNLLTKSTDGWNIKAPALAAGIYLVVKAIQSLSVALKGARLSAGWIGAGLLAIEGIATLVSTAINQSKKAKQESDNAVDSLMDNQSKINKLLNEAQQLRDKQKSMGLSSEETQKLYNITDQLKNVYPQVISYIDSNGNAHLKSSKQIAEERKETEKLIAARKEELKLSAGDRIESVLKDYNNNKKKISDLKNQLKTGLDGSDSHPFSLKSLFPDLTPRMSQKEIATANRKLIELEQSSSKSLGKIRDEVKNTVGYFNRVKINSKLSDQINNVINKIDFSKLSANDIIKFEKQIASIEDKMQMALNKGDKKAFAEANSDLKDLIGNFSNGKNHADKFAISYDKVTSSSKNAKKGIDDTTDSLDTNIDSTEDAVFAYDKLSKSMIYTGSSADDLKKALSQAEGNIQAYTAIIKGLISQGQYDQAVTIAQTNAYSDLANQIEPLNTLLQDLAQGKKISASEAMNLIGKEQDLAGAISIENGQVKVNADAVRILRDKKIKFYQDMNKAGTQQSINEINNTIKQINAYDLQLQSISTVAEAKKQLADLDDQMAKYAGMPDSKINQRILDEYNRYKTQVDAADKASKQLKELSKLASQGLKEVGTDADTTGKSAEDLAKSTDKSTQSIEKARYTANKYQQELAKVTAALNEINNSQSNMVKWSKEYQRSLDKEISLLKQKQRILKEQEKSLKNQIKSGNIIQYGVQTYTIDVPSSSSSSGSVKLSGNSNEAKIWNYLKSKGLSDSATAAIMGNLKLESGYSTTIVNPTSGATGIAQWLGGRLSNLKRFAASRGTSYTNLGTQLDFLWKELNGPERSTLNYLLSNSGSSASTLARGFERLFERSGGAAVGARMSYASGVYSKYAGTGSSAKSSGSSKTIEDPSVAAANKQAAIDQAKSDLLDIQSQILENADAIQQAYLDKVEAKLAEYDHKANLLQDDLAKIDSEQAKVNDTTAKWASLEQDKIDLYVKESAYQKQAIAYLKDQIQHNKSLTRAQKDTLSDELIQRQTDLYNLEKDITDERVSLAEKVLDTYKQVLQNLEQAATDSIQKMIDEIDKETNKKQHEQDMKTKQKSITDLQSQINALALDNSPAAKAKLKELNSQLQSAQQDLQDTIDNWNTEQRKANLETQKENVTKYYENMINDETALAKMRQDILNGNTKTLLKKLDAFYKNIQSKTSELGTAVVNNLTQSLNQAETILTKKDTATTKSKVTLKKSTSSKSKSLATINKGDEVVYLGTNGSWAKVKYKGETGYIKKNILRFDSGGYTSNSEGLAWLDKKEHVLNEKDTSNILAAVKIMRDLANKISLPSLNNNLQLATPSSTTSNEYNLNLHIGSLNGTKKDAEFFLGEIVKGVKRMGGNI